MSIITYMENSVRHAQLNIFITLNSTWALLGEVHRLQFKTNNSKGDYITGGVYKHSRSCTCDRIHMIIKHEDHIVK